MFSFALYVVVACMLASGYRKTLEFTRNGDSNMLELDNYTNSSSSSTRPSLASELKKSGNYIPDLVHPSSKYLMKLTDEAIVRENWHEFTNGMDSETAWEIGVTFAKVIAWGTGVAIAIAFPPAPAVAIAAATINAAYVTLATFLVTAVNMVRKHGWDAFSWKGLCTCMTEAAQNMLVGVTGGTTAVIPGIIFSVDALDMLHAEFFKVPSLAENLFDCAGLKLKPYIEALEEIRNQRYKKASVLLNYLERNVAIYDPYMGGCTCEDCKWDTNYCTDANQEKCIPYMYKTCECQRKSCAVIEDCFKNKSQFVAKYPRLGRMACQS